MGYLLYYLAWFALSMAAANPRLLVGFVLLVVLTPFLPDPGRVLARMRHASRLRRAIALNRADAVARRDLARLHVEGYRPRAAIPLLEEALARSPKDAELHLLRGRALLRLGKNAEALRSFGEATELDASVGLGTPYRYAGDAHYAEGHFEEAADAYGHYVESQHSDVEALRRLARCEDALGRGDEAKRRRAEARATFAELPGYLRRAQFGAYLRVLLDGVFS